MSEKQNPKAIIEIENEKPVVIELYPEVAPQAVYSFISLARQGVYNNHEIERLEPKKLIDMSYTAYQNEKAKYFIPNDTKSGTWMDVNVGTVAMGGYGEEEIEIAGGEFFIPLDNFPTFSGTYPVFGKIIEGWETIEHIADNEVYAVPFPPMPELKMHKPVAKIKILSVTIEGGEYPEPEKITPKVMPDEW